MSLASTAPEFVRFVAACHADGLSDMEEIEKLWETCRSTHEFRWAGAIQDRCAFLDAAADADEYFDAGEFSAPIRAAREEEAEREVEDYLVGYDCEGSPIGG